jgi:hypothetical protein
MVLARRNEVSHRGVKRVLTNRVEKDSTLTVVDVVYICPVNMVDPSSVEKNRFVARTIFVSVVTEDSNVPVRIYEVSSFVMIEEARTKLALN